MTRELLGVLVLAWLAGAFVGWCGGWIARGEQNRGWHAGVVRQLAAARADLAQARADLAEVLEELEWVRGRGGPVVAQPGPAVVHVHVTAPLPVATRSPLVLDAEPVAVLPAGPVTP